jgi:hypothetical protein
MKDTRNARTVIAVHMLLMGMKTPPVFKDHVATFGMHATALIPLAITTFRIIPQQADATCLALPSTLAFYSCY